MTIEIEDFDERWMRRIPATAPDARIADVDLSGTATYDRIWLYFSGGGLRAALGALGIVFFLSTEWAGEQAWNKVSRVVSVSGGSLANAALMHAGQDPMPRMHKVFRRVRTHGWRYPWTLLVLAMSLAVASLLYSQLFRLDPWGWWLADRSGFHRVLVALPVGIAGLVVVLTVLLVTVALVQAVASVYLRERIDVILGRKRDRELESPSQRLHVFATTDMRSNLPTHVATRRVPGSDPTRPWTAVLAHDRKAVANQVDFYQSSRVTRKGSAYWSAAWPFLTYSLPTRAEPIRPGDMRGQAFDVCLDKHEPVVSERRFSFMDGGMTGTLGVQLDPALYRADEVLGIMELISWPEEAGSLGDVCAASGLSVDERILWGGKTRRIVLDGGQHAKESKLAVLNYIPGVSGVTGAFGAIKAGLNHQITVDRRLANEPNSERKVWFVPVTGAAQRFEQRQRAAVRDPRTGEIVGRLTDVVAPRGQDHPHAPVPTNRIEQLMAEERKRSEVLIAALMDLADKVGNFPQFSSLEEEVACGAAAVANAFSEAQGLGANHDEMVELIERFEATVLLRGVLRDYYRPGGRRWPELEDYDNRSARTYVVAHQGSGHGLGERPNSLEAFRAAHSEGAALLECDVKLTADGILVALHGEGLGGKWITAGGRKTRISELTATELERRLQYAPAKIIDLVQDPGLENARWNFEAKDEATMRVLMILLRYLRATGALAPAALVSGGWSRKTTRIARKADPLMPTAATWTEWAGLLANRKAFHVAAIQLPFWARSPEWARDWLFGRASRKAYEQGIEVQWWHVGGPEEVETLIKAARRKKRRYHVDGFTTDDLRSVLDALEGRRGLEPLDPASSSPVL